MFQRKYEFIRHERKVHSNKSFSCDNCNATYKNISDLFLHNKRIHSFQNDKSSKISSSNIPENFVTEAREHTKYTCKDCSKSFSSNYNLERHINIEHKSEGQFVCKTCEKKFKRKDTLDRHEQETHLRVPRARNSFRKFFEECKYGPIFVCLSCHTRNYFHSVEIFSSKVENAIREKLLNQTIIDEPLKTTYVSDVDEMNDEKRIYLDVDKDGDGHRHFYLCSYCKCKLLAGKIPSTCILNECKVSCRPADIKYIKDVEVSLIAQNLQFMKILQLPKSRWTFIAR